MASQSHTTAAHDTQVRLKRLQPGKPLKHGGPVAEAVRDLVVDAKRSYDEIAEEVRKRVEGAHTTARSVASIVRGLRKDGYKVPERRHD